MDGATEGSAAGLPGFESRSHLLQAVCPQPRCLASLCLSVLICKMEISKPYLMGSLQKTK